MTLEVAVDYILTPEGGRKQADGQDSLANLLVHVPHECCTLAVFLTHSGSFVVNTAKTMLARRFIPDGCKSSAEE